jgi:hypothetical protein
MKGEHKMRNKKSRTIGMASLLVVLLSLTGGLCFAADGTASLTPEMAAKREMVRNQQEQRVTPEKRKAAAEALKAERIKVNKAKQEAQIAAEKLTPITTDNK